MSASSTRFPLGRVLTTPGALQAITASGESGATFLLRHWKGDWGDLTEEDRLANEDALVDGTRLLSAYHLRDGTKIWVITEADRSSTCMLLPSEY